MRTRLRDKLTFVTEMTADYRPPRDFSEEPDGFGRAATLRWKTPTTMESKALAVAARWQHGYAVRMREKIKKNKQIGTLKAYARVAGTSYDRLGKMLRGVTPMRLEDIAIADVILGGVHAPVRDE